MDKIKYGIVLCLSIITVSCDQKPDISDPKRFETENVKFNYPRNWNVEKIAPDTVTGIGSIIIHSTRYAAFAIEHFSDKHEYHLNELIDEYLRKVSLELEDSFIQTKILGERKPVKLTLMGEEVNGVQVVYKNRLLQGTIDHRSLFFKYTSKNGTTFLVATANVKDWDMEKKGFELIIETLEIQ